MRARARVRHLLLGLLLLTVAAPLATAQEVVFVVRHAERADGGSPSGMSGAPADPNLSEAGRARAARLAEILKDAGITRIFVTEFKRTHQTATPFAAAAHLEPIVVPSRNTPDLVKQLKSTDGRALVVGHSNTVPEILTALGVSKTVKIEDDEYGDLFIVVRQGSDAVLVTLTF